MEKEMEKSIPSIEHFFKQPHIIISYFRVNTKFCCSYNRAYTAP